MASPSGELSLLEPTALVLAVAGRVSITNENRQTYDALPLHRLVPGHRIALAKGARLSLMVRSTGNRRVYRGPARLLLKDQFVSVRQGEQPKVQALTPLEHDLAEQWLVRYPRRGNQPEPRFLGLEIVTPKEGAMLLNRFPEFVFKGDLPREGSLLIFDGQGKRFWVQQLDDVRVHFPNAVEFGWGQNFTWEVRKLTGGRVLEGSFSIASEWTARQLLEARVPDLPGTPREDLLFYGMRLQLANAYEDANRVWESLGIALDSTGRPRRFR
ncbi:hypothetical protein NQT62_03025 [Limnobacter humi]|uniref:Urease accessory protein UreD n=1 Tax=Limnobacter humi TaxID=1778671 RepID=A0ABT1WD19_9BURK|nr:hypothetical protein [Limnobacter humi]MCQ8895410.1 hypothetical protein [Limnobacter humi]